MLFLPRTVLADKPKPAFPPFVWICILFWVWRLIYLFFLHPRYYFLWPDEELYRGLFGKLLAENAPLSVLHLFPDNYSTGGVLTVGYLTSLVFRFLSFTVFSLKLIPLSFSFASLIIWYKLIEKHLSPRAAVFTALFFIFAPVRYISYSLTSMGDHYESILLTALTLWFFFKMIPEREIAGFRLIFTGILAGYSLWFAYIYSLTILSCIILLVLHHRSFFCRKNTALLGTGFLIGFSPWLFFNTHFFYQGLSIKGLPLWEYFSLRNLTAGFINLRDFSNSAPGLFFDSFLQETVPRPAARLLQFFYTGFLAAPLMIFFLTSFRGTSVSACWRRTPPLIRWAWIYGAVFLFAVQCSQFRERYYFFPLMTVSLMLAAFYWEQLLYKKTASPLLFRNLLIGFFIAVSLFSHISRFSIKHRGKMLTAQGYSYFGAGSASDFSSLSFCRDLSSCCMHFPLLEQPMTVKDIHELGMGAAITAVGNTETNSLNTAVPPSLCPLIFQKYFYYMLGGEYFLRIPNLPKVLAELQFLKKNSPAIYTLAARGAITEFSRNAGSPEEAEFQLQSVKQIISPSEERFYLRAISEVKTAQWLNKKKEARVPLSAFLTDVLSGYSEKQQAYLLQGAGRAFLRKAYTLRHPGRFIKQLENLPPAWTASVFEGVGMAALSRDLIVSRITLRAVLEPVLSSASLQSVSNGKKLFLDFFKDYRL